LLLSYRTLSCLCRSLSNRISTISCCVRRAASSFLFRYHSTPSRKPLVVFTRPSSSICSAGFPASGVSPSPAAHLHSSPVGLPYFFSRIFWAVSYWRETAEERLEMLPFSSLRMDEVCASMDSRCWSSRCEGIVEDNEGVSGCCRVWRGGGAEERYGCRMFLR
jgi:hypothetical protein